VNYLLDTHTLLWIVKDDPQLSLLARDMYLNPENNIFVSLAAIWELTLKSSIGKLLLTKPLDEFVEEHVKGNDIQLLNIEFPHIVRLEKLPFYHRDPFDRMIIAQLIENNLTILSADKMFDRYGVKRVW